MVMMCGDDGDYYCTKCQLSLAQGSGPLFYMGALGSSSLAMKDSLPIFLLPN